MQEKKNMWYLNNGASNHMCGDKDKFMELDEQLEVMSLLQIIQRLPSKEKVRS
jgi:hypothetical protein